MNNFRDWFWEIEQLRQGPDYIFVATFDNDDAAQLPDLVRHHPLPDFRYDAEDKSHSYKVCAHYDSYVDQHTYGRLEEMRVTGKEANVWYYTQIEVCDHTCSIQRALTGNQCSSQAQTETNLIVALAQSPKLTLVEWKIAYAGYSYGLVKSGTNAEELLAYLQL